MIYLLCLVLFCLGLYGTLRKRNVIKIITGLIICEYAANLLFIVVGYRMNGRAPVLDRAIQASPSPVPLVDPLPQAMVLTTIVIGMATTLLLVALAIRLYEKYGTFDITQIKDLRG